MNLEVGPISGEALQAMLTKIYASPADLREKARQAIKLRR
jgi:hypothetical protein